MSVEYVQHAAGYCARVHLRLSAGRRREIGPQKRSQTGDLQAKQVIILLSIVQRKEMNSDGLLCTFSHHEV